MWKQIFGVLTIVLLATGCGSSGGRELSAAEPPADAAAQASQLQPATEQPKKATRMGEAVSRPAARTTSPQPAYTRNGAARVEPADAPPARTAAVPVYREFTLPVGTTLPLELTTNAIMPTGGKTRPIDTISIDMTPNQIGSKPSEVMSGNVSCKPRLRRTSVKWKTRSVPRCATR